MKGTDQKYVFLVVLNQKAFLGGKWFNQKTEKVNQTEAQYLHYFNVACSCYYERLLLSHILTSHLTISEMTFHTLFAFQYYDQPLLATDSTNTFSKSIFVFYFVYVPLLQGSFKLSVQSSNFMFFYYQVSCLTKILFSSQMYCVLHFL